MAYYSPIPKHLAVEHPYGEDGVYITDPNTTALVAKLYTGRNTYQPITMIEFDPEAVAKLFAAAPVLAECLREAILREKAHAACASYEADCGHDHDLNRQRCAEDLAAVGRYETALKGIPR